LGRKGFNLLIFLPPLLGGTRGKQNRALIFFSQGRIILFFCEKFGVEEASKVHGFITECPSLLGDENFSKGYPLIIVSRGAMWLRDFHGVLDNPREKRFPLGNILLGGITSFGGECFQGGPLDWPLFNACGGFSSLLFFL